MERCGRAGSTGKRRQEIRIGDLNGDVNGDVNGGVNGDVKGDMVPPS